MANAAKLAQREPVRMIIVGYPGSGKTGLLASAANMGYKIRLVDFDGNYLPLIKYTKPEFLKNIDIVTFEDKLKAGARFMETVGKPEAFAKALKAMDHWEYTDEDGEHVDLGYSKDWGCDTILVVDGLTFMGKASMRRAAHMLNKTPDTISDRVWGLAMAEQESFVEKFTAADNKYHAIMLSHLKMIGPSDIRKGDSDLTQQIKEAQAELIPTRLYPSALGKALPPVIAGHFPIMVLAEQRVKMGKVSRIITAKTTAELDLKIPMVMDTELPIETGLATILSALAPPLSGCKTSGISSEGKKE